MSCFFFFHKYKPSIRVSKRIVNEQRALTGVEVYTLYTCEKCGKEKASRINTLGYEFSIEPDYVHALFQLNEVEDETK